MHTSIKLPPQTRYRTFPCPLKDSSCPFAIQLLSLSPGNHCSAVYKWVNFPPSGYSIGTQHYFFKRISYCNPWQLCQKLINHLYLDLFLDSLFSYWSTCLSNTTLSWYCCFVVRFESGCVNPPALLFFLKIAFALMT